MVITVNSSGKTETKIHTRQHIRRTLKKVIFVGVTWTLKKSPDVTPIITSDTILTGPLPLWYSRSVVRDHHRHLPTHTDKNPGSCHVWQWLQSSWSVRSRTQSFSAGVYDQHRSLPTHLLFDGTRDPSIKLHPLPIINILLSHPLHVIHDQNRQQCYV